MHVHVNVWLVISDASVAADVNLLWPQAPVMVQLILTVAADDDHSDSLVASAAGLLG